MKDAIAALFETVPSRPPQGPYEPTVIMLVDAVLAARDHERILELAGDLACIARRQRLASSQPKLYAISKSEAIPSKGLTARTYNLLRMAGVVTVADLGNRTADQLLHIPGFKQGNLEELIPVAAQFGIYYELPSSITR